MSGVHPIVSRTLSYGCRFRSCLSDGSFFSFLIAASSSASELVSMPALVPRLLRRELPSLPCRQSAQCCWQSSRALSPSRRRELVHLDGGRKPAAGLKQVPADPSSWRARISDRVSLSSPLNQAP